MNETVPNQFPARNTQAQKPMWMVLHGGSGAQRYRWDGWAEGVVTWLTGTGYWVSEHVGEQIELRHRSRLS